MKSLYGIILLFFLGLSHAASPLTVIYDSGNTSPITPYLPESVKQIQKDKKQKTLPFTLPISTPSMQPGTVTVTPKSLQYLQRPLFLVGADQISQAWLLKKRDQLKRIGAVGLLIQADDAHEIDTMNTLASGLRLLPVSAEGFAKKLGLSHYPVLLSREGWEQ